MVIHINICMYIQQNSSKNNEHKNLHIFKQKPICVFFDIFIDICKYVYSNKCVYKEIKYIYIYINININIYIYIQDSTPTTRAQSIAQEQSM